MATGLSVTIQSAAAVSFAGGTVAVGPITVTGSQTPVAQTISLASGNNTFTVPAGSIGCVVSPPSANAIVLKAKTTSGDTGVNIPQGAPTIFLFDTANVPTSFFVNAASTTNGYTQVLFF